MKAAWRTREIAIVAFEGVLLLDVAGPTDVFSHANFHARRPPPLDEAERYRVTVLSTYGGQVATSSGLIIGTAALPVAADAYFDTVVVAGGPGVPKARHDAKLLHWLRAVEPLVRRIGSVCGGAYLLAEAGLLAGRAATTHWRQAARLRAEFPDVAVDADAMYVNDGHLFSAAGVTAGIDLALSLVADDFGRSLALLVARDFVVSRVRSSGTSQYSSALATYRSSSTRVERAVEFALARLESHVTVEEIASHVAVSSRQLTRMFNAELGLAPARFMAQAQVELARELLAGGRDPLEKVALRCGFSGRQQLTRAFTRALGIGPGEFRARHLSVAKGV